MEDFLSKHVLYPTENEGESTSVLLFHDLWSVAPLKPVLGRDLMYLYTVAAGIMQF